MNSNAQDFSKASVIASHKSNLYSDITKVRTASILKQLGHRLRSVSNTTSPDVATVEVTGEQCTLENGAKRNATAIIIKHFIILNSMNGNTER